MEPGIEINPQIHFGKPCVAGTRVSVENVMELLEQGLSFAEIIRDYYPGLTAEQIRACLRFARKLVAAEEIHIAAARS